MRESVGSMQVPSIGAQLYSVRVQAERSLAAALEQIAACGYSAVEPFSLHGFSPSEFGRKLRSLGLSIEGFHLDSSCLARRDRLERSLDEVCEVGARRAIIPWWDPAELRTAADVERLAELLNRGCDLAGRRKMELGYHNHAWEFAHLVDGKTLHSFLFERLEPAIFAEVDVYWAAVGGRDPVAALRELGPRVKLIHLKDGPADGEHSPMTALGDGVLDLPAIVRAAGSVDSWIVEIDECEGDVFDALARSAAYLHRLQSQAKETPGGA